MLAESESLPPPVANGAAPKTPAERRRRIFSLALPIIGAMVSQNIFNIVDMFMVGKLGDAALAAVGLGGMAAFLLTALILGLSAGVQTMAARRVGQGRTSDVAVPLNGGLLLALATGVPWSLLIWFLVPVAFPLLIDDPAVWEQGVPYLQARVIAIAALGMNFCFRGHWSAVDRTGLYMGTLVVMHAVNIALNWVLIYGNLGAPALGAEGAGIANAIALWLGTALYFVLGWKNARGAGFLRGIPDRETLRGMVRLSSMNGLQQLFFAGGMLVFHVITGSVGTQELAASNVIINLLLVGVLPGIGFGLAALSLVGHSLGRKDATDARRWGFETARIAFIVVAVIGLPGAIAPRLLLSPFLHHPDTLALAEAPLRLVCIFLPFDAAGMVLLNSLLGAGDHRRVMLLATTLQWGLFLPLAAVVGPVLGLGLAAIYATNVLYRQLQLAVFAWIWRGESWAKIEVG